MTYTNETLKAALAEGYKTVTFTKKTGEVAIRRVTRDNSVIPLSSPRLHSNARKLTKP